MIRIRECDLAFLLLGPIGLTALVLLIRFAIGVEYGSPHWQSQLSSLLGASCLIALLAGVVLGIRNRANRMLAILAIAADISLIAYVSPHAVPRFAGDHAAQTILFFLQMFGFVLIIVTLIAGMVCSVLWFASVRPGIKQRQSVQTEDCHELRCYVRSERSARDSNV